MSCRRPKNVMSLSCCKTGHNGVAVAVASRCRVANLHVAMLSTTATAIRQRHHRGRRVKHDEQLALSNYVMMSCDIFPIFCRIRKYLHLSNYGYVITREKLVGIMRRRFFY